ncbi:gastrula zinc finger protein XlCGF8.2DB [Microplitis demolitor]|uniref:gastrula zinc finger protein XlCGF8.2DB n=1 Tax=Microplitis demolitor TaxID=69319 RepID=UPI0004CD4685|nr:gastrula zinc finger protein XlCGF8.2DB [Microplitis demolitor]
MFNRRANVCQHVVKPLVESWHFFNCRDGKDLLVDSERSTTGGSKKKHKGRDRVRGKKKAPYRCETCAENFETELDLLAHHTTIDDISCCHSETPRASRRRSHRRSRGHSSKSDTNDSDGKQSRPSTPVKNHQLKCFDCQKTFKKKKYLKVHMALHGSPHVCHICGAKKTSEYDLNIHVRRHNKEFTEFCPVCKKGFYLKANLKNHMSRHTSVKPFECDVCKKPFGNQIYLKSHMRIHSQPDTRKKYTCSICEFETFYSYCFKEHMWTHTGEGQLPCQYCGKLIRRDYMKIHIRIHTGEKPEVCEFCGRTFASRRYLVKHRRIHTGEKPYKCHRCDRAFTQRGTLTSHLRTHRTPPPLP